MGGLRRRGGGRGTADNGLWRKKRIVNNLVPEVGKGEMTIKVELREGESSLAMTLP